MSVALWIIAGLVALVFAGFVTRWLLDNPWGNIAGGLLYRFGRGYTLLFQGLRVRGAEHMPEVRAPGPLIVVANHTAGVDPLLVQAVCPFPIRWVMAQDMRHPWLEPIWRWHRVIFVDRERPTSGGLREAVRHLKDGGVLGIFPEGGLERPAKTLRPFLPGVGVLVRKTKAPVLPLLIEGGRTVDPAWASLWRPGRFTVHIKEPVELQADQAPNEIAAELQNLYRDWTGWEVSSEPAPSDARGGKGSSKRSSRRSSRGSSQDSS